MSMTSRSRNSEGGSTVVEFALIASLLFGFIFGVASFSLIEAGNSVGSNAARDGARLGILNYACAEGTTLYSTCTTDNYTPITKAVASRLVGLVKGTPTVTVKCVSGTSVSLSYVACDPTTIVPGVDLLEVKVKWNHVGTSPFVSSTRVHSDTARMVIVGKPSGVGTAPGASPCTATVTGIPTIPTALDANNHLLTSFTVTLSTSAQCTSVLIGEATGVVNNMLMGGSNPTFTYLVSTALTWSPGTTTFDFRDQNNALISTTGNVSLTLVAGTTTPCAVSTTSFSTGNRVDGNGQLHFAESVSLTTTGTCGAMTFEYDKGWGDGNHWSAAQAMTGGNGSYSGTIPANDPGWVVAGGNGTRTCTVEFFSAGQQIGSTYTFIYS